MPFDWPASISTFWQNVPLHHDTPFGHFLIAQHFLRVFIFGITCLLSHQGSHPSIFFLSLCLHRFFSRQTKNLWTRYALLSPMCIHSFLFISQCAATLTHLLHLYFLRYVNYILCAFLSKATLFSSRGKFLMSMRPCLL